MNLLPVLCATVAPALLILAAAYPLRPQGGRFRSHPVPARQILARLAAETRPRQFGDPRRPAFTVQPRRIWVAS